MDMKNVIEASIAVKQRLLGDEALLSSLAQAVEMSVACLRQAHRIWFCGNGGSAADAQHLAAELSGRFYRDRPSLPAEALHCLSSYLTAVANDYSYEEVYARLVNGYCQSGDLLIGLSTSGNSRNIVQAFLAAREHGIYTIGLTGAAGGALRDCSDLLLTVPSTDTPRIQECHILLGHILCEHIERQIFGSA